MVPSPHNVVPQSLGFLAAEHHVLGGLPGVLASSCLDLQIITLSFLWDVHFVPFPC